MVDINHDEYLQKCHKEFKECDESNFVKKYILYNNLSEAYYGHREESPEYLSLSEEYALKNIELLPKVVEEYKRLREKYGDRRAYSPEDVVYLFSDDEDDEECQPYPFRVWCYSNSIDRLRIIYDKSGRIADAIKMCDFGIDFWSNFDLQEPIEKLTRAKEKLFKKL